MTNKEAHQLMKSFTCICDDYNRKGFTNLSKSMLKVYQDLAIECLKLIKFLREKEDCRATRAYHIFCGKLLIRLSSLRYEGRKETDLEYGEYIRSYL